MVSFVSVKNDDFFIYTKYFANQKCDLMRHLRGNIRNLCVVEDQSSNQQLTGAINYLAVLISLLAAEQRRKLRL